MQIYHIIDHISSYSLAILALFIDEIMLCK